MKILLTNKIYKDIKKDITNLKYKENDVITEKKLAQKYNVSKSPVREALCRLKLEGIIEVLPHKGYYIKPISIGDLMDIFQMRLILEIGAMESVIENATLDDVKELKKIANTKIQITNPKSYLEYSRLNYKFHLFMVEIIKNKLLKNVVEGLLIKLRGVLFKDLQNIDYENMKNEHLNIICAIEKKDINLARKIMQKHLSDAKKEFLSLEFIH